MMMGFRGWITTGLTAAVMVSGCSGDEEPSSSGTPTNVTAVQPYSEAGNGPGVQNMGPGQTPPAQQMPGGPAPDQPPIGQAPPPMDQPPPPMDQLPPPMDQPPAMAPPNEPGNPDFTPPTGQTCLNGTGDFNDLGPYRTATMDLEIADQGPYTVFYPTEMQDGCHPVVAWGNGTGVTGSGVYAFYQEHAASWGIVVVAAHNSNTGSGAFHRAALDWALAQNEDSSSMFFGKLNGRAGTSGHSQGGAGANAGANHPAVEAIGNVQGAFGRAPAGKAFLCLTGTEDIAIEGCRGAVNGTTAPALYANWEGGTHTGTATLGGFIGGDKGSLQYRRLYTAWFRCFLGDDSGACGLFTGGPDCQVCKDPGWAEIYANNY